MGYGGSKERLHSAKLGNWEAANVCGLIKRCSSDLKRGLSVNDVVQCQRKYFRLL